MVFVAISAPAQVPGATKSATGGLDCRSPASYGQSFDRLEACRTVSYQCREGEEDGCSDARAITCFDRDMRGKIDAIERHCVEKEREMAAWAGDLPSYVRGRVSIFVPYLFGFLPFTDGYDSMWAPKGLVAMAMSDKAFGRFAAERFEGKKLRAPFGAMLANGIWRRAAVIGETDVAIVAPPEDEPGTPWRWTWTGTVEWVDSKWNTFSSSTPSGEPAPPAETIREARDPITIEGIFVPNRATDLNLFGLVIDKIEKAGL